MTDKLQNVAHFQKTGNKGKQAREQREAKCGNKGKQARQLSTPRETVPVR